MSLLAGVCYDPATAVSAATSAALAMTALDTTNLRLTFTAPTSGKVKVVMGGVLSGNTTFPQVLFGVLSGTTVMKRKAPDGGLLGTALTTTFVPVEASFIVDGLGSGSSYTFDAAYGVETGVTGTALKYGGPNDTTNNNAWGGFTFEIWQVT